MTARTPLLRLALRRRRRMLVAVVVGAVAFEALIVVVTATVSPDQLFSTAGKRLPSAYRAFSGSGGDVSIASYPGLLGAGLTHPFWIALQLTVIGSFAVAAVASDVESGTIELVMVRPVTRLRLLAERTAALLLASAAVTAAATLTVAAGVALTPDIHAEVGIRGVLAAGLMGFGFTFCVTGPALAVSAAGRRRSQVLGTVVAVGAVGFALHVIALAWSPAGALRYVSPFHYYAPGDALAQGTVLWSQFGVLVGVGAAGLATAHVLLYRRDLAP